MLLPTTLSLAAAAAIINIWISMRIGRLRMAGKIMYGDGGNEMLMRRMRAHANFIENAPLALILIAAIEITGKDGQWLPIVGALFMAARVLHPFGMDGGTAQPLRTVAALVTMLVQIGLAVVAVLILLGRM